MGARIRRGNKTPADKKVDRVAICSLFFDFSVNGLFNNNARYIFEGVICTTLYSFPLTSSSRSPRKIIKVLKNKIR